MAERTLDQPASDDVPTVVIMAGGAELPRQFQVRSVTVTKSVNRIPFAIIEIADGDATTGEFELSDQDLLIPGAEVEIQAGYHSINETVFTGIVVRHAIRARQGKLPVLHVVCKDPAVKLTVGRRSKYFYDTTDGTVMEDIISAHGLTADVSGADTVQPQMVQYQCSDWDLLVSRAENNGLVVIAKDGTVSIAPPDPGQGETITLELGATILSFEAEFDAESQWSTITTVAWDQAGQAPTEVEGEDPGFPDQGDFSAADLGAVIDLNDYRLHHGAALSGEELEAWGRGIAVRSRLSKIRGRVRCQGFSGIEVGNVVKLERVGARFSGNAYVSGLRHHMTPDNWVTDLQTGIDVRPFHSQPDVELAPAAGVLPPIAGLHTGVVTALEGDPDGENRIRVRLPLISPEEDGVWTRIATLDAGAERGTFFLPEIDDEVVVGFLHADPRHGVVLGMLHSSAKPAPFEASDDNHEKGYVSREKMRVVFNDDLKSIVIETPDSNRVFTLDEDAGESRLEDADGNKITMSADGIVIESAADLELTASGDIKLTATNIENAASA
ncbi:MAG: type VI secretion system tip protein VgrG, partial [Proteobacteria bacterium]|nr:type VI secretion system tip protein VgrG [Pseudomonadota bacterium]